MGKMRNAYNILVRKPKGKIPFRRSGISGRIILKWILNKQDVEWIQPSGRRLVNMIIRNFRFHKK
jgi:hypothetical protein